MDPKCPGCPTGRRHRNHYLCLACWRTLPASTRGRLSRRDARAMLRLRQLHAELTAGTPLAVIRVVP
ncbi:hypothetical protein [Streptomyces acidiscabies]|uniref:Uncharacterized protein n=1 Tax=Streptomyces acidiscabies TaxID=42234 RepID=A0AAP6BKZ2_9ACTN|nr:hypothetical protein [Streptomyces acidiscabies]MBZ3909401.1 hypothetical protein [Streptomyces acidiscabies]MDX2966631.1 hypothetical protein [Streptomyces acidiscabies]MDX3796601.1 hypothetical protein [Streptomyces acidiscabies]